ncbi:UDP-glucose 4-epimerase [Bacillus sp. FJAT-18019]|nr:UDP-glucose 4-epimerase [Bacillus sp. FJAT-18019]
MRVIVTGGAGFIGSSIVSELITKGHTVGIIDNLSTGKRENINLNSKFYNIDINSNELMGVFEDFKPEIVIHHAAQVSVSKSMVNPLFDEESNIRGTINLLNCCVIYGVKKILYASSAAVYGIPKTLPISENHAIDPISFYGISKYVPETYIKIFSKLHGLNYTIFRYANVYGPKQDQFGEGGVISIFINKILEKEKIVINGDGLQTRDFIFVQDIVAANMEALDHGDRKTLNISTNKKVSINELVTIMSNVAQEKVDYMHGESRLGDIMHSLLDNSSAMKELNWRPNFDLYEGLKLTFDYYKEEAHRLLEQRGLAL